MKPMYTSTAAGLPAMAAMVLTEAKIPAMIADWLQERGARGFIGEYGVPKNDIRWNAVLDTFMEHIHAYGLSGTYWAGGKNWNNYALDCSPTNNYTEDSNQMEVLEKYVD